MKILIYSVSTVFVALIVVAVTQALQLTKTKAIYDLGEKCRNTAASWFKDGYGGGNKSDDYSTVIATYQNHYNKKMNICFIEVNAFTTLYGKPNTSWSSYEIIDLNENKSYGSYFEYTNEAIPAKCSVQGQKCVAANQWTNLAKPFMED